MSRPSVAHPLRPHGYRRPDGSSEVNAIGKPADLDELQVAQNSLFCQAAITYPSSNYTSKEVLIERIIPEYHYAGADMLNSLFMDTFATSLGDSD